MTTISNGESGLSVRNKLNSALASVDANSYATRAAFIGATIPAEVTRAAFFVGGNTYAVVRDATGPIAQSNGQKWRPNGDVTPQHFGAVGDGVADDTAAVQAAINYGKPIVGVFGATYSVSALTYGEDGVDIKDVNFLHRGQIGGASLLQSANFTVSTGPVRFSNVVFDGGDTALAANVGMVRVPSAEFLDVSGCEFKNYRMIMLSSLGNPRVSITNSRFHDWGIAGVNTVSNPAVYIGPNFQTGVGGDNALIDGNHFYNGEWCAAYCYSRGAQFTNNTVHDVKEAAFFSFRERAGDPAEADCEDLVVSGNVIYNISAKYISATGFEIGAKRAVVSNNVLRNIESSAIKILDVGESVLVSENVIENSVRAPETFPSHGQIEVVVSNETSVVPNSLQISGNIITDTGSPKLAPYAISVRRYSGAETVSALRIMNNDVANGFLTQAVFLASGVVDQAGETIVAGNDTLGGTTTKGMHILRRDSGDLYHGVDVDDANNGGYQYYKDGILRWASLISNTETFEVRRYNDAGVFQAVTMQMNPASNAVIFAGRVTAASFSVGVGGPLVLSGAGSPEGVQTAGVGSTYHRTDGGAGTSFYVKESGVGTTGWVAK